EPRPHSHEGERDHADERLPIAEIEFKWNLPLQNFEVSGIIDEDSAIPAREEKWFAEFRKQPALAGFARTQRISDRDRRVHRGAREIRNGIRFPEISSAGNAARSARGSVRCA